MLANGWGMELIKFTVKYGSEREGVTETFTFATSDGRQVIGTYGKENIADKDIVDEMIEAGFKVTVVG
jgi:hypothetical protein